VSRPDAAPAHRRDAARSRRLLQEAAAGLFAERGFDRTTLREVAERAGVDAALVARYFGSKTGLYVATLAAEGGDVPADLLERERTAQLLDRVQRRGTAPVLQTVVRPLDDEPAQRAAREAVHARLVGPLRARFEAAGLDRTQLRAELAVAAFAGIALARTAGTLDRLAAASSDELVELVVDLLAQPLAEDPDALLHHDGRPG
jgi:AcrR family transcriptional regulator